MHLKYLCKYKCIQILKYLTPNKLSHFRKKLFFFPIYYYNTLSFNLKLKHEKYINWFRGAFLQQLFWPTVLIILRIIKTLKQECVCAKKNSHSNINIYLLFKKKSQIFIPFYQQKSIYFQIINNKIHPQFLSMKWIKFAHTNRKKIPQSSWYINF
jgi:hypothetical protein